jgi:N,N-dimethylformamidase
MRLIGWVSDERYVAVADALLTFVGDGDVVDVRSSADGGVRADLAEGRYDVTVARDGYGAKRSVVNVSDGEEPHQFRLLSEQPVGYVWPKWVRAGDTAGIRVSSPEPYRLALARHGASVEDLGVVGWIDEHGPRATVQVVPDDDYTQTGVEWFEHEIVTAPTRSGLYYFHLETESGKRFSFPWVVAPREPSAPVAVLASTNTWSAYNNWGGRSNYINANRLPATPTVFARADLPRYVDGTLSEHSFPDAEYLPLSFKRPEPLNQIRQDEQPTDPIRGRQPCHLAAAEWRFLAWLERERFGYDLFSEAQLHDGTLDLDCYRVLVISTHPEYWSREMYRSVKEWIFERGGRLMYLGGNGIDCEVEFLDAATLRFLTEDEDPEGTDENRMHRSYEPTSALLGVSYTESGAMTSAPYRTVEADHWAFAGTGLRDGDLFGVESLHERCPGGASGHETDKRRASSPEGTVVLAKGLNVDDGGAELVYFETPSGGAVFSAGSITWTASVLVDDGVSGITRNVLERLTA